MPNQTEPNLEVWNAKKLVLKFLYWPHRICNTSPLTFCQYQKPLLINPRPKPQPPNSNTQPPNTKVVANG